MEPRDRREEAPSRGRDLVAIFGAFVAHAAVIGIAWPFAAKTLATEAPPERLDLIELDVREIEPPKSPAPAVSTEPEVGASEAPRKDPRGDGGRATPILPPAPRGPEGPPPAGTAPEGPSPAPVATVSEYGEAPTVPMPGTGTLGGTGVLGGVGGSVWGMPGVLPPGPDAPGATRPEPPKVPVGPKATVATGKGTTLLRDDLRAHDAKLGLGNPGGTVVQNAVAEAVRNSALGADATAVLVARVGGDGVVISVSVQQFSSGDARTWSGIAQAAQASIGKKKLGLAGLGPKGAVVRVRVSSRLTYPSGSGGDSKGGATSVPAAIAGAIAEGPDRTVAPAQGPDGDACAPERRSDLPPLCGVGMTVGRFDVTDLATKRHRYVHASFTVNLLEEIVNALTPTATTGVPATTGVTATATTGVTATATTGATAVPSAPKAPESR